ncbi:MAG: 50S ribosomal protein L24 [Spirochaetia bacterium]|jgi:large subunit ribosomal protein L24|nr:50S ribosomal protein L24 [Spirochaetia bacterium]
MEIVKFKLKKDDLVKVVTGKEKGKSGKIVRIDRIKGRVIISGLNMIKKARKPKKQGEKGGIVEIEAPIAISNVMIVCKKCGPTRIGIENSGENKVRKCKKCGEVL